METPAPKTILIHRGKRHEVRSGSTLRDAVRKIGLSPEAILAAKDGQLVTDDRILQAGEEIQLISVISGG